MTDVKLTLNINLRSVSCVVNRECMERLRQHSGGITLASNLSTKSYIQDMFSHRIILITYVMLTCYCLNVFIHLSSPYHLC